MICEPWGTVEPGTCVSGCDIPPDVDPDILAAAEEQASAMLRLLSGNQYGVCADTLRPLGECPVCRKAPCCGAGDRVRLFSPLGPITGVTEVRVNGTQPVNEDEAYGTPVYGGGYVIDPTGWRFYPSSGLLYAVGGSWPAKDNKTFSVGALEVDVTIGTPPDAWALAVWSELVCELVRSCSGLKCRLPRNATQVSSQGVTVSLSEVELKHLIPSVAGWVAAVNPHSKRQPSFVSSPDLYPVGGQGCGC